MHQLRQRRRLLRLGTDGIHNQLFDVFAGERAKGDLLDSCPAPPDRFELAQQRMGAIDFVVAVGAYQHQVTDIRLSEQILEQVECCRIEPLQIVQEQGQRMFRAGEHADKAPEYQLEAALCLLRRKLGNGWLVAGDESQFRDEVRHEPAVRTERLPKSDAPNRQIDLALPEQRAQQVLKSLHQRRIGNIALVLVELS
jgi:hypothetical protein